MTEKRSLSKHIIRNIFITTTVIVTVIAIVLWFLLCGGYKQNRDADIQNLLQKRVNDLELLLERNISSTDYIIKNNKIVEGLNKEFTDGYELLQFVNEFKLFLDAFNSSIPSDTEQIIVYTSNPTLVESYYMRKMESMSEDDKELVALIDDNNVFRWKEKVQKDALERSYVSLFRKIPLQYECVIEIKIYTDDILNGDSASERCRIFPDKDWQKLNSNAVSMPLFNTFVITLEDFTEHYLGMYVFYLLIVLLGAAVFLVSVLYLISRATMRITKDIIDFVEQIDNDNVILKKSFSEWRELDIIEKKIYLMNQKINDMNREKYESQLVAKNLEMENLNAKINPHLLYNSLSAIKLLAFKTNNYEIEQTTELLIDYYRLMLNRGQNMISIGEEIEYLGKYIQINEISKRADYEFDVDITSDAYDVKIPHMLLQPIVENAIYHGLNGNAGGYIGFKIYFNGDDMIIEITDDGKGIETEKLSKMNDGTELGYGLTNVISRLSFYYPNRYELKFTSDFGNGTCVVLRLSDVRHS